MSEIAINSAQVWVKLQKRLGNNMSQFLSPEELGLLNATIDAGGTIGEQGGFDPVGPSAEVVLDFAGPFEWSATSNVEVVANTPAASINVAVALGAQTPEVCQSVAEAINASSIGPLLNVQTRSGPNVIQSEIVLTAKDGSDITISAVTLT